MDDVLHALRIKGRARAAEVAAVVGRSAEDVEKQLDGFAADGLAVERMSGRRPGWLLTAAGRERAAAQLEQALDATARDQLGDSYSGFLKANDEVKRVCAGWQTTSSDGERFELLDEMHELHDAVAPVLDEAGAVVERFRRYRARLSAALERVPEDPRYMVSPSVDSIHTVWFECHEDFLLSLGRSRAEEGSF
ncbi:hypothetical protein ACL02T_27720 [Pseudonocardia sp. RS010]|uniref:hypothetical protein n=1 Tax=Pseudonocardia sp. RS010 TaxID=3385979 RepID=UPI00399F177B